MDKKNEKEFSLAGKRGEATIPSGLFIFFHFHKFAKEDTQLARDGHAWDSNQLESTTPSRVGGLVLAFKSGMELCSRMAADVGKAALLLQKSSNPHTF